MSTKKDKFLEMDLKKADKRGYKLTCWEKNTSKSGVKVWMCKEPGFISMEESFCGFGESKDLALKDCNSNIFEKKQGVAPKCEKPGKAKSAPKPNPSK